MPSDTPAELVSRRIHAVLTRAKAAHRHAATTAAEAYAKPAAPPVPQSGQGMGDAAPGGAA